MHCRRLTRLTNAFSKKFENFEAAVSLNFAYYNFSGTHKALRMTPAQAAGIESSAWTIEDLLKNCGECKEYIERLHMVITQLHECVMLSHTASVPVREVFQGQTAWEGVVEVFDLIGHPKAQRCYAWTYGEPEEFITVLEIPPVVDAQSAVKVGVAHQIKRARK